MSSAPASLSLLARSIPTFSAVSSRSWGRDREIIPEKYGQFLRFTDRYLYTDRQKIRYQLYYDINYTHYQYECISNALFPKRACEWVSHNKLFRNSQTQSMIAYGISTEYFWKFQWKLYCSVGMLLTWLIPMKTQFVRVWGMSWNPRHHLIAARARQHKMPQTRCTYESNMYQALKSLRAHSLDCHTSPIPQA